MIAAAMTYIVFPMLAIALVLAFARLVKGPSIADRVVALDMITTMGVVIIAAYALTTTQATFLDIAVLVAVLSFLGTVAFAYYIERRA
jgi:multicomponent Na+:H+ antiporter subunit F